MVRPAHYVPGLPTHVYRVLLASFPWNLTVPIFSYLPYLVFTWINIFRILESGEIHEQPSHHHELLINTS